ncbi:MAG: hypothetical protein R2695_05175 [Acidimicrobiales bacterium]
MDIWDSLRLTVRHWKWTVPVGAVFLLALSLYSRADTVFKVDTTVVLVGPLQVERVIDGQTFVEDQNPFFTSPQTMPLTRVLVFSFEDPSRVATVRERGWSTKYTMEWDNRQPLVITHVEAPTPELATETAAGIIDLMTDELVARQDEIGAPELERARLSVLAVSNPKEDFKQPRLFLERASRS